MKAILGQFYKTAERALKRAEELKRLRKGKVCFIVVGAENGFMVISERSARACGIVVPLKARRYKL